MGARNGCSSSMSAFCAAGLEDGSRKSGSCDVTVGHWAIPSSSGSMPYRLSIESPPWLRDSDQRLSQNSVCVPKNDFADVVGCRPIPKSFSGQELVDKPVPQVYAVSDKIRMADGKDRISSLVGGVGHHSDDVREP